MTAIVECEKRVQRVYTIFVSPNSDGLNDLFFPVFSPYGLDTKSFSMSIFDRWGKLVYDSKDVTKGWDGTILIKVTWRLKKVFLFTSLSLKRQWRAGLTQRNRNTYRKLDPSPRHCPHFNRFWYYVKNIGAIAFELILFTSNSNTMKFGVVVFPGSNWMRIWFMFSAILWSRKP